jgi:hypothetical protein
MAVFLKETDCASFIARINAVKADSSRQFGSLDATAMLCHLRRGVEISLGEVHLPDTGNFFTRTIGRFLVFYVVPWPKGKIKAPPAFTPVPENNFEAERELLRQAIDRFIKVAEREPEKVVSHPVFGPMTMTYWCRVHGKHFDHHLKQFGV